MLKWASFLYQFWRNVQVRQISKIDTIHLSKSKKIKLQDMPLYNEVLFLLLF